MGNKNIFNIFKITLGQYCAINQFVELSKRSLLDEHQSDLSNGESFVKFAEKHKLVLSEYNSDLMLQTISHSYIINVNSCFELFLKELYDHIKKYSLYAYNEKKQDESWLECVCNNIFQAKIPNEAQMLIDICEYYRLVRNNSVHKLPTHSNSKNCETQFRRLKKHIYNDSARFGRLSAPNEYTDIQFDDFVMFSRSVHDLATILYDEFTYDNLKVLENIKESGIAKKFEGNQKRLVMFLQNYIITNYKASETLNEDISTFLSK